MTCLFGRSISGVVVSAVLASALPAPACANEFSPVMSLADRERVELLLTERGVQAADARARAAALTDEEANRLAAQIDALPAGRGGEDVVNSLYGMAILSLMLVALVVFLIVKAIEAAKSTDSPAIDASRPAGGPAPNPAPY
jgi:hypothetical protein